MTSRQATRANYDRLSRWYDLLGGSSERPARGRGLELLDIQPGERVLEIGCGTGEALTDLARRAGPSGRVCGLDLSAGMLSVARGRIGRGAARPTALVRGDAARLPFPNEAFDAAFLSFTLELFPVGEMASVLRECGRALRPGGRLGVVSLLQRENPNRMERAYEWAHRRWPRVIDCRPIPLAKTLIEAGLEVSRTDELSIWGLAVGVIVAYSTNK